MKRNQKAVIFCIIPVVAVILAGIIVYITKNGNAEEQKEKNTSIFETIIKTTQENLKKSHNVDTFRNLVEDYYSGRRICEFVETGTGSEKRYVLRLVLNNDTDDERMLFSGELSDCMEECLAEIPYEGNEDIYSSVIIVYRENEQEFTMGEFLSAKNYDGTKVYNEIYLFLEQMTLEIYENKSTELFDKEERKENAEQKSEQEGTDAPEVSDEILQYYLSQEPECTYIMADGTEYGLVMADRACGSSYYVLVSSEDGGKVINLSPHNGSGGQALWLTFLEDEQIGFTGLAYSGGSRGKLYWTEDGGKSFTSVEYPSAKIKLPDGTYYNPFIMPERVYEENGKLYMEAGQGPDGDYYGEEGFCAGLYESTDLGKTWVYVKEIPAGR